VGGVAEGSADVVRGRATEGYDFVEDRTRDGRKIRMLNVVDEFTRECLTIQVGRKLGSADVIDVLADLFIAPGRAGIHPLGQRAGVHCHGCEGLDQRRRCQDSVH